MSVSGISESPASTPILALQTELHACILGGTTLKVKNFLEEHPELIDAPFENGSLPLHLAIDSGHKKIVRLFVEMKADLVKKDSKNFDALDHVYLGHDYSLGELILKNITKETPLISLRITVLSLVIEKIRKALAEENSSISEDVLSKYKEQIDVRKNHKLPIETAINKRDTKEFLILFINGANLTLKTLEGNSLLHLAVDKGQLDIALILLIAGLDPNEKDNDEQTLLSLAAQKANMQLCYLLLAYGATLTSPIIKTLENVAKSHDPLHITSMDTWYFLSTAAAYLAKSCITSTASGAYLESLPALIHTLGATWVLYKQLPTSRHLVSKTVTMLTLTTLEMLPATNIAMSLWRTVWVAASAFSGIRAAYQNYSDRPEQALQKGLVHTVNALHSLHSLKNTIVTEFHSSETIKELRTCTNITSDTLFTFENMTPEMRMQEILKDSNAFNCLPIIEIAFPGWNCDTFKKMYREESLKFHPDKTIDGNSGIQVILNAAKSFWTSRC